MGKKYYEAYDERYKQIHGQDLQWSSEKPSKIVAETIQSVSLPTNSKILEIGCGEGRDAYLLLTQGFDVLATDVSCEAVSYCKKSFLILQSIFKLLIV